MSNQTYKFGTNHTLENLWLKFSSHPQGGWVMGIEDASKLHELIKKYKPTQILELGTGIGCATAIMASALENGRIMTLDQSKKCIALAKELIPHELKEFIQFEYSPATVVKPIRSIDPFQGWSAYLDFQLINWDFVVIDGPGPFMVQENGESFCVDLPNGDIISILPRLNAGTKIFVQGRRHAVQLYKRYLSWYLDLIEAGDNWTLFERTNIRLDKDLLDFKNSDMVRGLLIEGGYFKCAPSES